jgi:Ser/Thr protein kinase RdoA (MazF antagonist)
MDPLQTAAPKPSYAPESMTMQAPPVSLEEAAFVFEREYGQSGTPQRLIGERDQNFALLTASGERVMLKLIHPAEDPAVTNFQTEMLLHVERRDPGLPVQRVLRTLDGQAEKPIRLYDGSKRMMRLVTFLPGRVQRGLPPSAARAGELGSILARLQRALEDFEHPADSHEITWDIAHADRQRSVLPELRNPHHRALLEEGLERFEALKPILATMRCQVVHNDLSYDNVVVEAETPDRVSGVLDFGDATRTAIACDVAVAASCNLTEDGDPLDGALPLITAFHAARPLLSEEVMLLHDLIIARLIVRVGITEWRAVRFPENRDYILRTTPLTWRLLEVLLRQSRMDATNKLLNACGMELTR